MIDWAITNTLVATALAAGVLVACRIWKFGPATRHALWLVVLIRLMIPPVVVWPWAIDWSAAVEDQIGSLESVPATRIIDLPPYQLPAPNRSDQTTAGSHWLAAAVQADSVGQADAAASSNGSLGTNPIFPALETGGDQNFVSAGRGTDRLGQLGWRFWTLALWTTGSALCLVVLVGRTLRLAGVLRSATPAANGLTARVEALARELGLWAPPLVRSVSGMSTPFVCALGRTVLVWPDRSEMTEDRRSWNGVLLHELAHIRRKDHWVGWLELFASVVYWWHPLYWYARYQLQENSEQACDAWVVRLRPHERRYYAEDLVRVCQLAAHAEQPLPLVGIGNGNRRSLERRLTMIFRESVTNKISLLGAVSIVLMGLLALPGWSQDPLNVPAAAGGTDAGATDPDLAAGDDLTIPAPQDNRAPLRSRNSPLPGREPVHGSDDLESDVFVAPSDTAATQTDRINALERTIQALAKTIRQLRQEAGNPAMSDDLFDADGGRRSITLGAGGGGSGNPFGGAGSGAMPHSIGGAIAPMTTRGSASSGVLGLGVQRPSHIVESNTITLTRTTYKLSPEKAQGLIRFVGSYLDVNVQTTISPQTADRPSTVTVTTTTQAQQAIGQLILLMQKNKKPKIHPTLPRDDAYRSSSGAGDNNPDAQSGLTGLDGVSAVGGDGSN